MKPVKPVKHQYKLSLINEFSTKVLLESKVHIEWTPNWLYKYGHYEFKFTLYKPSGFYLKAWEYFLKNQSIVLMLGQYCGDHGEFLLQEWVLDNVKLIHSKNNGIFHVTHDKATVYVKTGNEIYYLGLDNPLYHEEKHVTIEYILC